MVREPQKRIHFSLHVGNFNQHGNFTNKPRSKSGEHQLGLRHFEDCRWRLLRCRRNAGRKRRWLQVFFFSNGEKPLTKKIAIAKLIATRRENWAWRCFGPKTLRAARWWRINAMTLGSRNLYQQEHGFLSWQCWHGNCQAFHKFS